jgi:hypothetical protein
MPRIAKAQKKPSEKEASGDGDGFEAISSVGVSESTSLNLGRKSVRMARTKSKVAESKKKSSKAATSTSEEHSCSEAGGRKPPPEELVELEKPKGKVTTLWQRGKPKRVVVVDVPTDKDTGPPLNKNGVSFCKQCNVQCICPSSTPHNLCCDGETHISLNNVGEYVVFPAQTINRGIFSAVNKIVVQAQLFADTAIVPNCQGELFSNFEDWHSDWNYVGVI